jgi:hypothetical protein
MKQKHQVVRAPGLVLPRRAVRRLIDAGIYAEATVTLERQDLAKRYVVRGVESGGANEEIGRYVTFADEKGRQVAFLHPLDSIGFNGVHAVVMAPVLVRVEMFRSGRSYQLLISEHRAGNPHNGRERSLETTVLFDGADGYLDLELWKRDRALAGAVLPQFYSRGGETAEVPEPFRTVVMATTKGVACIRCSHSHYLVPRAVSTDAAATAAVGAQLAPVAS